MRIRTILALAAVLAAGNGFAGAPALPGGTWAGAAEWTGAGMSGSYAVERTFVGNTMTSRFEWNEGERRTEEHALTFALGADPVFDVLDGKGEVVGRGYCADGACAYRASLGQVSLDESFRWTDDGLSVLGSKSGPGFAVVWTETLEKK